jgi:hypothetical protein
MESLQIRTGQVRLRILNDAGEERGIFSFNPEDIESARMVLSLQSELLEKEKEFNVRQKECTTQEEQIELLCETVEYFENLVDKCFGAGSSELLFGGAKSLSMFFDFFDGIIPYYETASKKRIAKYKKNGGK